MQNTSGDQIVEDIYSDSDSNETSPNVSTDITSTELKDSIDVNMNEKIVKKDDNNQIDSVKIKQEPVDNVEDMLNELGDNLKTSAAFENPLFVIEILDSSDEES